MATYKNLTGNFFEIGAGQTAEINIISDGTNYYVRHISDNDLNKYAYGVRWNKNDSSPVLTRIGNPEFHRTLPIQSQMRGCVHKNGVIQYYLRADNWNYKENGEESVLDGTDGDVGIEVPRFYIWQEDNGDERAVYTSERKLVDYAEMSPHCIISPWGPTLDNTDSSSPKLRCVKNTTANFRGGTGASTWDSDAAATYRGTLGKPKTNITRATARTYARNNNTELLSYTQYKNIIYWLYVIEYANFNSQAAFNSSLTTEGYRQGGLGDGVTTVDYNYLGYYNSWNPLTPCGYYNEIGNGTGVKAMQITMPTTSGGAPSQVYNLNVPRWRGIENPFGDYWKNLDGIVIVRPAAQSGQDMTAYIINDPANYTDSIPTIYDRTVTDVIGSDGWVKEFHVGNYADILSTLNGGSQSTYMCDYIYSNYLSSEGLNYTALSGGGAYSGSYAGLGYLYCQYSVSRLYAYCGFLTCKVLE